MTLTGVADLVGCIACGEKVNRQKPHPDLINLALKKAGQSASSAVTVGDTPFDAEAANAASVAAVGLLCGGFSEGALLKAGCKAVYRDPAELNLRNDLTCRRMAGLIWEGGDGRSPKSND